MWSPDNRWLAYTRQLPNHQRAVFVYSLEERKATQVTDGMSDALYPNFDKNGKYLYFTASTNMGLATGWLDMTSIDRPVTRAVYVAVLRKDLPSPLAPESDEEKAEEKKDDKTGQAGDQSKDKDKDREKKEPVKVTIDFENLSQRILALPIPERNYQGLTAGKEGILYLVEGPQLESRRSAPLDCATLRSEDAQDRKAD